jgi:hypothetical protein
MDRRMHYFIANRQRNARRVAKYWAIERIDERSLLSAAPVLVHNTGFQATGHTPVVITTAQLQATDADSTDAQITFGSRRR